MASHIQNLLFVVTMTGVFACNRGYPGPGGYGNVYGNGYGHGHGWGVVVVKKPTLLPKLKHAFIEGKLSVDYHKIVSPSLKPLPYKKGIGWVKKYKGWGYPYNHIGPTAYGFPQLGYGVGKLGHLENGYGQSFGYGHGPIIGQSNVEHQYIENKGGGHNTVTPLPPITPHVPIIPPHGHHVSEHAVTVVEKALPGVHHPST